jgi:phosphate starvation-inducible PhoH-like protein
MTRSQRKKIVAKKQHLNEELHEIEELEQNVLDFNDSSKLKIKFPHKLTKKQKEFINLAMDESTKVLFVKGPAGCAKTILAVYCGLLLLKDSNYEDIVYVRSVIESSEKGMGYLPGDIADKISPYLRPLEEKLDELISSSEIKELKKHERISAIPINFMRGVDFRPREMGKSGKVIIADEVQNISKREFITFLTRIGENCKVFLCGDPSQSDIRNSGFDSILKIFDNNKSKENGVHTFTFDEKDIVRSELVKFIVEMLEKSKDLR